MKDMDKTLGENLDKLKSIGNAIKNFFSKDGPQAILTPDAQAPEAQAPANSGPQKAAEPKAPQAQAASPAPQPQAAITAPEPQAAIEGPEPQAAIEGPEPQAAIEGPEPQAAITGPEPQAESEDVEMSQLEDTSHGPSTSMALVASTDTSSSLDAGAEPPKPEDDSVLGADMTRQLSA